MMKIVLSFIGGFVIGFLIIWGWNAYTDQTPLEVDPTSSAPDGLVATSSSAMNDSITSEEVNDAIESSIITVRDQKAGDSTIVSSVELKQDGWVVVHEEQDGFIGNALGAKRRDAGVHQDLHIPLLRSTEASKRYWVVLYQDNGDRVFDLEDDFPIRNESDKPITSSFVAQ